MKVAAIDIGSNALRLLVCNVYETTGEALFKKSDLVRVPLRLGEDSFIRGKISEEKINALIKSMFAFKLLMEVNEVEKYRACATSAMRDASNNQEVLLKIKDETGIAVELIDGSTEANLIYANHIAEHLDRNNSYLYIDVGGGSTELTLFSKGKTVFSRSFNIGTIRWLHQQVTKQTWTDFKEFIRKQTEGYQPLIAIGSGGNINKIQRLFKKKEAKAITLEKLMELQDELNSLTYQERIEVLGLKPDRADVIIPATKIFSTVMKNAGITKIMVPEIGLADGIVHQLYEDYKLSISNQNTVNEFENKSNY